MSDISEMLDRFEHLSALNKHTFADVIHSSSEQPGSVSALIEKYEWTGLPDEYKGKFGMINPEESDFSGMTFLIDMLMEAGKGVLFSKPRFGLLMGVNLSWSVLKKTGRYAAEKKALDVCKKKRLAGLYISSLAALDYLDR